MGSLAEGEARANRADDMGRAYGADCAAGAYSAEAPRRERVGRDGFDCAAASKLAFCGVSQTYDGARGATHALGPIDLAVEAGEALAILGPSGCGKSTALLIACGLLRPSAGRAEVDGIPIEAPRLATALILQDFGLMPWKTVAQNAGLGLQVRRVPKRERAARVASALERVGLSEFAGAYPAELSGGMRQRLAMARALACDIDLLLMDEPLSALDALLREEMQNMLKRTWREQGYAQVLVTHSIEEAVFLGQRVAVMTPRPGRVAYVLDNPEMETLDWRDNPLFFERCRRLREVLRDASCDACVCDAGEGEDGAANAGGFGRAAGVADAYEGHPDAQVQGRGEDASPSAHACVASAASVRDALSEVRHA